MFKQLLCKACRMELSVKNLKGFLFLCSFVEYTLRITDEVYGREVKDGGFLWILFLLQKKKNKGKSKDLEVHNLHRQ